MQFSVIERFIKYTTFDTRAKMDAEEFPSTPGQLVLARALVEELRAMEVRGEIRFRRRMGIGMRFSYRQTGEGFVWIEFVSNEPPFVETFLSTARRVAKDGVVFHSGKYVPR